MEACFGHFAFIVGGVKSNIPRLENRSRKWKWIRRMGKQGKSRNNHEEFVGLGVKEEKVHEKKTKHEERRW